MSRVKTTSESEHCLYLAMSYTGIDLYRMRSQNETSTYPNITHGAVRFRNYYLTNGVSEFLLP